MSNVYIGGEPAVDEQRLSDVLILLESQRQMWNDVPLVHDPEAVPDSGVEAGREIFLSDAGPGECEDTRIYSESEKVGRAQCGERSAEAVTNDRNAGAADRHSRVGEGVRHRVPDPRIS